VLLKQCVKHVRFVTTGNEKYILISPAEFETMLFLTVNTTANINGFLTSSNEVTTTVKSLQVSEVCR